MRTSAQKYSVFEDSGTTLQSSEKMELENFIPSQFILQVKATD